MFANRRHSNMETKQEFCEQLERYRALAAETTDPIGSLLLKHIIADMEDIERRWEELRPEERHA